MGYQTADAPVLWDSTIRLGKNFNKIIAHPVPIDMHILKAVKRSPLGLDLYLWAHVPDVRAQDAAHTLSWRQLYRQFGVDAANAGNKSTVNRFRSDCLRELKKIKRAVAWAALSDGHGGTGAVTVAAAHPVGTNSGS